MRTFDKSTKEMNLNPCLLYENGKFSSTLKEVCKGTYDVQMWLDNIIIMHSHWVNHKLTVFDGDIIKTKHNEKDEYYYVENGILIDLRCLDNDTFGEDGCDYYYNDGDMVIDLRTAEIIGNIYEYDYKALQEIL